MSHKFVVSAPPETSSYRVDYSNTETGEKSSFYSRNPFYEICKITAGDTFEYIYNYQDGSKQIMIARYSITQLVEIYDEIIPA